MSDGKQVLLLKKLLQSPLRQHGRTRCAISISNATRPQPGRLRPGWSQDGR